MFKTKNLLLALALLIASPALASSGGGGVPTTTLTGDVSGSGNGAVATTLATVNSTPGSFGSSSQIPTLTINAKGLVTVSGFVTITPAAIGAPTTTGTGASGTWAINISGNAATVTTNANLTGDVTSVGNATTLASATVFGKTISGFSSAAGTVTNGDTLLTIIDKLNGNITGFIVNLASGVTGTLGITNGGTGAASAWLAATNLTGTYYVVANGTDTDIATAFSAAQTAAMARTTTDGNNQVRYNVALSGGVYTLANPLVYESEFVNLYCNGSVLDASGLAAGTVALTAQNTLGVPKSSFTLSTNSDCTVKGASTTLSGYITANTTGVYVAGTPSTTRTLSAAITSTSATTMTVSANTNIPATPFTAFVDSEIVEVTNAATTTWTIVRGFYGSTAATHLISATVSSWHPNHVKFANLKTQYFYKNITIGDSAWLTEFDSPYSANGYFCLYAHAATQTSPSENIKFFGGVFSQCADNMHAYGQILRFYSTSFDYQSNDGLGVSSQSYAMDIEFGSYIECYGCHVEMSYGSSSSDTNNPIHLQDNNSTLIYIGGHVIYTGTLPKFWTNSALGYSDHNSQTITFRDTTLLKLADATSTNTTDDSLFTSADSTHVSTAVGNIRLENTLSGFGGSSMIDQPSCVAYEPGPNWYRSGVGGVNSEMAARSVVTGTLALANQSGTDGTVTPRSGSAQTMQKITGAGKWIITVPIHKPMYRTAWAMFFNAAEAGGTVTISERQITAHPVWNGTSSFSFIEDARTNSTSYTIPNIGSNTWTRASWRNTNSSYNISPREADYMALIIDTTSMTGTLYVDDACWSEL